MSHDLAVHLFLGAMECQTRSVTTLFMVMTDYSLVQPDDLHHRVYHVLQLLSPVLSYLYQADVEGVQCGICNACVEYWLERKLESISM